ncbi:hypothetical protein Tco_0968426 [Tanacetum coccineum]
MSFILASAKPKSITSQTPWIPRTFGKLLEEIRVTWSHLEKKRTRLQLYTKVDEENAHSGLETASQLLVTPSEHQSDCVRKVETASSLNRLKEALEDSAKQQRQDNNVTPSRPIFFIYYELILVLFVCLQLLGDELYR